MKFKVLVIKVYDKYSFLAINYYLTLKIVDSIIKVMCNPNFNIFLNQHSNVYFEKDGCQAFLTRKHYVQIFFWVILLAFSWDILVWKVGQL